MPCSQKKTSAPGHEGGKRHLDFITPPLATHTEPQKNSVLVVRIDTLFFCLLAGSIRFLFGIVVHAALHVQEDDACQNTFRVSWNVVLRIFIVYLQAARGTLPLLGPRSSVVVSILPLPATGQGSRDQSQRSDVCIYSSRCGDGAIYCTGGEKCLCSPLQTLSPAGWNPRKELHVPNDLPPCLSLSEKTS